MMRRRPARSLIVLALAGVAVLAPPISSFARPKKHPVVEAPPPPPPPRAGPVALPRALVADAAAYQAYLERVTATSPTFSDGSSIAQALKDTAAYEPRALIRGAVAYGAIAALAEPSFVEAIRNAGNSPENRRLMMGYMAADPAYALLFKGSDLAAADAREAIGGAGLKLFATGKVIRNSSYTIQHQDWSKQEVSDRSGRLASVEAAGKAPPPPAGERIDALQRAISGAAPLQGPASPAQPPYTPLVAHAVQLAAIAALGEAGDGSYDQLSMLAADDGADTCLHMAKLNLYQCLAVAKPHYEDVFCMGQHGMIDTGACLTRSAGLSLPAEPAPPPPVQAATKKRKRSA